MLVLREKSDCLEVESANEDEIGVAVKLDAKLGKTDAEDGNTTLR